MTDSNNIYTQNNPFFKINDIKSPSKYSPLGVSKAPIPPQKTSLGYSSTDQRNGIKVDNIYHMLTKFFQSYETLVSNYEVIVSNNTDFYAKFLDNLESNNEGLDVGSINNEIISQSKEGDLYGLSQIDLITKIKSQNNSLKKCHQYFLQFQQLLGSAKGKIEEQRKTQYDLNNKARTILRAYHKRDPQLLEQLGTNIPVASKETKPVSSSSLSTGNVQQEPDIYSQAAQEQALRNSYDTRTRAIEAEKNVLGQSLSSNTSPMMTTSLTTNPGPSGSSPFLNPSEAFSQVNTPNALLPLGTSSGQSTVPSPSEFGEFQSVEMISTGKEKGLVLSGQPIAGGGDFLRYRVLFEQGKHVILKYVSSNSLKKVDYPAVSSNVRGKVNFILKSNIISNFIPLKKEAQDIWEQNETNRKAALDMISDPVKRETIIQYGIFKMKKRVSELRSSTEDVFFINLIPQGFENNNLIKYSFPDTVEKGLHQVEVYVIQLATVNPQNTLFYNISPNDIIRELMRQWYIFIQALTEKKKQLQIIYEREYQDIKGLNPQAFKRGIQGEIKNLGISLLGQSEAEKHGLSKVNHEIPSEKEYRFFSNMLDLSFNIVLELRTLLDSYNEFDYEQDRNSQFDIPKDLSLDYQIPLGGGGKDFKSKKNMKVKRRNLKRLHHNFRSLKNKK